MLTMQDACWIQLLLLATSLERRSTAEIPQHQTPGRTNLQFDFDDHSVRKEQTREQNNESRKREQPLKTELPVELSECTPEAA